MNVSKILIWRNVGNVRTILRVRGDRAQIINLGAIAPKMPHEANVAV